MRELSLGYDGANRWASRVTDGATATTGVSHDGLGRATSLTVPSTETASLGYDDSARALSVTGFGSGAGTHEQTYDPHGRLASYTPPAVSGAEPGTTRYGYDDDGVLRTLTLPSGASVGATTDAAGRPASLALAAGDLTLSYDSTTGQLDALHMANTAGAQDVAFSYDGPLLMQQRFTGAATADVDYAYDDALRVSSVTIAGEPVAYDYDRDGLVTQAGAETLTRDPDSGVITGTTAGAVRQIYATSGLLELVQHSAVWSGGLFGETITSRDGAGRILEKTETTSAGSTARGYAYDADGRVTEERRDGVRIASYEYDAQGNRTALHRYDAVSGAEVASRAATHDARDRLTSDGATTYTYDAAGRRATRTTAGAVTSYGYDELGHLVSVTLPSGTEVEYTYDALGRRTGRTTDGAVDGAGDTAWVYSSGPGRIATLNGDGSVRALWVYGTRSWTPDLMIIPNGASPSVYSVITDHRGSVRAIVGTRTGLETFAPADYDAFGNLTASAAVRTRLGYYGFSFAGGILDADTGLIHLGARDYDPETGTWIQPDPIRFGGGDTNLYAYVGGDPVNGVDPSGRYVLQLAGGLIGAGAQAYANYNAYDSGRISGGQYAFSIAAGFGVGVLTSLGVGLSASALAGAIGGASGVFVELGLIQDAAGAGGSLSVGFESESFVPAQRTARQLRRHRFALLAELTLTSREAAVAVDLSGGMARAEASRVTDADGTRRLLALFPAGVTAQADMGGGAIAPFGSSLHLRMTELTQGEAGPSRMPADLLETSGYTYAFELSVDKAEAMGAEHVVFDQPVPVYTDNFLHMPVGTPVPFVYVATAGQRIRRVNVEGVITTVAGTGVAGAGGPGVDAQLEDPRGLSFGPEGTLYFVDGLGRVRALTPGGVLLTLNDRARPGSGEVGTPLRQANLGVLATLAVDASGDLYVGAGVAGVARATTLRQRPLTQSS